MIQLFARVELFFDSCEEMKAWIQEKDAVLSDGDVGRDLETVRALQRRHQVTELENKPNPFTSNNHITSQLCNYLLDHATLLSPTPHSLSGALLPRQWL